MEPLLLPLWSTDETRPTAAKALGVKRTRIKQLVASGALPSIKHGGQRVVAVADIHEYIERLRTKQNGKQSSRKSSKKPA